MSESKSNLFKALSAFQGEIKNARKTKSNPFFKSNYADLAEVLDTIRPTLAKHGLSIIQATDIINGMLFIKTILAHSSGEFIEGNYPVLYKDQNPQTIGSGVSYARRYSLMGIVGIASEDDDDDGTMASPSQQHNYATKGNVPTHKPFVSKGPPSRITEPQVKRFWAIAHKANWSEDDVRQYLSALGLKSPTELTYIQYDNMCQKMEKFPRTEQFEKEVEQLKQDLST